jgi:hypothetical protein
MTFRIMAVGLLFSLVLLGGCSTRLGNFTVLSTKNTDIGKRFVRTDLRVKGEDGRSIVVVIPMGYPNIQEAVDRALDKVGGRLMTDAVVYYDYYYIPYIYGEYKYRVEGDVWKEATKNISAAIQKDVKEAEQIYVAKKDENGQINLVKIKATDPVIKTVQ